jgi:hypothetical protein
MAYTKTAWVNDSTPSIDATNLNKLETQYETAETDFAPISGTGSLTVSAWSTNTSATGFSVSATFATSPSSATYIPFVNFTPDTYSIAKTAGVTLAQSTSSGFILFGTSTPSGTVSFNYVYVKG